MVLSAPSHDFLGMLDFLPSKKGVHQVGLESPITQMHENPHYGMSRPGHVPVLGMANTTSQWWRGNGHQAWPDALLFYMDVRLWCLQDSRA
jgi:hypothetical protein